MSHKTETMGPNSNTAPVSPLDPLDSTEHRRNSLLGKSLENSVEVPSMIFSKGEDEGDWLIESGSPMINNGYGATTLTESDSPKHSSAPLRRGQGRRISLSQSLTSLSRSFNSFVGPSGDMFTFKGGRPVETTIVAEDDALPPQTPLYGSSRSAANALSTEMRRVRSADASDVLVHQKSMDDFSVATMGTVKTLKEIEEEYLAKCRTTFINDTITFAEGTIPQSIIVALVIGCVCGFVAYIYYNVLDYLLEVVWKDIPENFIVDKWPEHLYILWIPLASFVLSVCCGLSIYLLGEPGDLAYTIKCLHEKGYKATHHIIPMIAASMFTILSGASLGPEAPLVAICAACAGFISRTIFQRKNRNVVRKHSFMGMAGALSAFFGVPLGGSLFSLEVASRFGIEYFEHLIEVIFAGEVCVAVFRSLAGLPLGAIWRNDDTPTLYEADASMIVIGAGLGLVGAGLAYTWANFHWRLMDLFGYLGLLDDENRYAVPRVLLGAIGVVSLGMLVPQTMFWGEFEFPVLATLSPASDLPHLWPTSGLFGFEMDSCMNCFIVGFCKLIAISFTVAGGYRGGFIFPFFTAGAAFGRAFCFIFPGPSPVISTLCFAASINVAITRTALATPLILCFLSGEQYALPSVLSASIVSLLATGYVPFIKSQIVRSDIDFSLYYKENKFPAIPESIRERA